MNAVVAAINLPPASLPIVVKAGPASAVKGAPAAAASAAARPQAPEFSNFIQSLLGSQRANPALKQPLPSLNDQTEPADASSPSAGSAPLDSAADGTESNLPQAPASVASPAQLADAMIRSMFAASSNVASLNTSAPVKMAQPRAAQESAPAQAQLTAEPLVHPAVLAALQSPLMRSADTAKSALRLPHYASVIPAGPKPAVAAAPLAFGLRVTSAKDPAPPSTGAPSQPAVSPEQPGVAPAAPAPAAEAASVDPQAAAVTPAAALALKPAAGSNPAAESASGAESPNTDPKTRAAQREDEPNHDAATHAEAVQAVAAASTGAFSNGGSNFGGDSARQMPAEIAGAPETPAIGKTQNPAAASATDALRAAAPSAPAAPALSTTPLKEIAVRIATPQSPAVDVHFAERAGQLHVAVRTADGGLQSSLRQDLGTLVNSLERSGYRAETFTTRVEGAPAAASTQTGFQNGRQGSESEPGSQRGFEDSSQNSGHGQQQQRRDSRPAKWIEELENQQ